jgi:NADH pyrophosphatase NudC (nudix superfamily)
MGVPRATSPKDLGLSAAFEQEIGVLDEVPCFAVDLAPEARRPEGMVFRDLRSLWGAGEDFFLKAGRAKQIVEWNRRTGSAAGAGRETEFGSEPLAKSVPSVA